MRRRSPRDSAQELLDRMHERMAQRGRERVAQRARATLVESVAPELARTEGFERISLDE